MAEELLVNLTRNEHSGFGFSLWGAPGLPPIIYNILDNSPAAINGKVEIGDVILKINDTDVLRYNTKEVLKCLRLSTDPVTLKIKRDPTIKATVKKNLLSGENLEKPPETEKVSKIPVRTSISNNKKLEPAIHKAHTNRSDSSRNGSFAEKEPLLLHHKDEEEKEKLLWQPLSSAPKFEAYMMTGEHILNISKMTPAAILPKKIKKLEKSRYGKDELRNDEDERKGKENSYEKDKNNWNSVPNSPNESELSRKCSNSCSSSPKSTNRQSTDSYNYVRTSRSEDQLQGHNISSSANHSSSSIHGDDEEDMTSSLNTLLDTRNDSERDSDRIVWTYNAPVKNGEKEREDTSSSPTLSSPLLNSSGSPTSVSSSIISNHSGSKRTSLTYHAHHHAGSTHYDLPISEAISNISSPDYHDNDDMCGLRDCAMMELSDRSDRSDSTLLLTNNSEQKSAKKIARNGDFTGANGGDYKIVIQVKGPDKDGFNQNQIPENEDAINTAPNGKKKCSDDDLSENESENSDAESESFHQYSPKAVDIPSAIRLAKRLYSLDGFKKSDVSRHLSKNNEFSRAVAEEYLKYFDFHKDTLDLALRKFLKQFSLTGETQERERVLVHFSNRYLDCNPGAFHSQDAVHTLTCAIMLLNSDIHNVNVGRKMSCNEFIDNLAGLNESENFPKEVLKQLYYAIKNYKLEWAQDEEIEENIMMDQFQTENFSGNFMGNPFLDVPINANAIEYKKGYVMRKCCYEANAKKSICCLFLAPFHKRSWKMFYCTLKDLVLYLHKDENGLKKSDFSDNFHNAIRIHHALATKADDYKKKQYVFRLQTADQAEYLFQTSDSLELQSWIDTINYVSASLSAPPLEAAVGSQKKFQRPLLPCSHTKLSLREQMADHEERVSRLGEALDEHRKNPPEKGSKSLIIQNYKEKETYLIFELKRYKAYYEILASQLPQQQLHYPEPGLMNLPENSISETAEIEEAASSATGLEVETPRFRSNTSAATSSTVNRNDPD